MKIPTINLSLTGENIIRLRKEAGISVKEMQDVFGFSSPQAIYKWQRGNDLPTVDNLVILSALFNVGMDEIIVTEMS